MNVRETLTIVTDPTRCVTIRLVPINVGVRTVTEGTDTHVHVRSSRFILLIQSKIKKRNRHSYVDL